VNGSVGLDQATPWAIGIGLVKLYSCKTMLDRVAKQVLKTMETQSYVSGKVLSYHQTRVGKNSVFVSNIPTPIHKLLVY